MTHKPLIVGVGGTTRPGSTSEKALRLALERATALGCDTLLFGADALPLEPYEADTDGASPLRAALVAGLRAADGVLICSPGYHGSVSGLVKNALDFTEDLRDDALPYLEGRAVGCVAVANGPQALGSTVAALRSIAHALRGWPTPYAAMINALDRPFGADGATPSAEICGALDLVATQVVEFALMRQAWRLQTNASPRAAG